MSRIDEIQVQLEWKRQHAERFKIGALKAACDEIDYLLSQLKDGGAEERQLIQDLASFPFDVLMDENAPRVAMIGSVSTLRHMQARTQEITVTAPTEQCDFCAHPSGYFPAELEGDKWIHRGRDNDAQICTATPHPCPDCGEMKTSPECMNCQAIGIERIEREARQSIQAEETETSARCVLCGHAGNVDALGVCGAAIPVIGLPRRDRYCGCKCVFPASTEVAGEHR